VSGPVEHGTLHVSPAAAQAGSALAAVMPMKSDSLQPLQCFSHAPTELLASADALAVVTSVAPIAHQIELDCCQKPAQLGMALQFSWAFSSEFQPASPMYVLSTL
jgi:hypothetical protein